MREYTSDQRIHCHKSVCWQPVNWHQWCFDDGQVERGTGREDDRTAREEKRDEGMSLHACDHVFVQELISI